MLVAFSALVFFEAPAAEEDGQILKYVVHFDSEPKSDKLENQTITLTYFGLDRVETIELSTHIESVDEVYYVGNRCMVIGTLQSHAGQTVDVVDATTAEVVASEWCGLPVVSPDHKRVVFENWYPRVYDERTHWPLVLAMDVARAEDGPVQVYPEETLADQISLMEKHLVVSPKVWSTEGDTLAFLDVYGDYDGDWTAPYKLYCVVVRFNDGKPLPAKRSLVDVDSFVRDDLDPKRVAFTAESLEIVDGRVRGKLYPQSYWIRSDFSFDLELIDKEQTLSIDDIHEPVTDAGVADSVER